MSASARQRTAEIGVRIALGAAPGGILGLMVGHGLRMSVAGMAIGGVAALGLTRMMASMLVGVSATDPATFAGVALLFLAIAGLASWLPGAAPPALTQRLRCGRSDPSTARSSPAGYFVSGGS